MRNYARGNRQIIRIRRTFACISAGGPRLWHSVMQIDQVSQEPRDCACSQRHFTEPFFHWKFILTVYLGHDFVFFLTAILTVRVISSIRKNITWTWVFVYRPFTSQPNTRVITSWEFISSRLNGAKCASTNRPSWVQRVDLPPLRHHAVI